MGLIGEKIYNKNLIGNYHRIVDIRIDDREITVIVSSYLTKEDRDSEKNENKKIDIKNSYIKEAEANSKDKQKCRELMDAASEIKINNELLQQSIATMPFKFSLNKEENFNYTALYNKIKENLLEQGIEVIDD